jgi:hypothetical protein
MEDPDHYPPHTFIQPSFTSTITTPKHFCPKPMEDPSLRQKHDNPMKVHLFAHDCHLSTTTIRYPHLKTTYGETNRNTETTQSDNTEPSGQKGRAFGLVRGPRRIRGGALSYQKRKLNFARGNFRCRSGGAVTTSAGRGRVRSRATGSIGIGGVRGCRESSRRSGEGLSGSRIHPSQISILRISTSGNLMGRVSISILGIRTARKEQSDG